MKTPDNICQSVCDSVYQFVANVLDPYADTLPADSAQHSMLSKYRDSLLVITEALEKGGHLATLMDYANSEWYKGKGSREIAESVGVGEDKIVQAIDTYDEALAILANS